MKIENVSDHPYEITAPAKDGKPARVFAFPRLTIDEAGRHPGVGEMPDDVLADLLATDQWTKGVFDSGDLVAVKSGPMSAADKRSAAMGDSDDAKASKAHK